MNADVLKEKDMQLMGETGAAALAKLHQGFNERLSRNTGKQPCAKEIEEYSGGPAFVDKMSRSVRETVEESGSFTLKRAFEQDTRAESFPGRFTGERVL